MKVILSNNKDQRSIIRFNMLDTKQVVTVNHSAIEGAMSLKSKPEDAISATLNFALEALMPEHLKSAKKLTILATTDGNKNVLPISISVLTSILETAEEKARDNKYPIIYHVVDIQDNKVIEHQIANIGLDKDFNWKRTNGDDVVEEYNFYADKNEKPQYALLRFAEWLKEMDFGVDESKEIKH